MTILVQLENINRNLGKFHEEYLHLSADKDAVEKKYAANKESIVSKYKPDINKIEAMKRGLLAFHRIIGNYTSKGIQANCGKKLPPDIPQLYSMFEKVEKQRFSNEKAARTAADKMTDLISSNIAYMDCKLAEVTERQNKELAVVVDAMNKELTSFSVKKNELFSNVESYIAGDDVKALNNSLDRICGAYKITDDCFSLWDKQEFTAQQNTSEMLLGIKRIPMPVPDFACGKMKDCLVGKFDVNTKTVAFPVLFGTDSFEEITVEYTDKNESRIKNGIQALILNFMRCFGVGFKVSLLDYVHYNADLLGPLADFAKGKNSLVDKVAGDEDGLRQAVSVLASCYRNIESRTGTESVYQYNMRCRAEERIPLRILIINKQDETFSSSSGSDLSYILNNAGKFGITVIRLLKKSCKAEKECSAMYSGCADDACRKKITSDTDGSFYIESGKDRLRFEWPFSVRTIPADFIEKIQKILQPPDNGTKYFKRYGMHLPKKSVGRRKPIILPFAVDDNDNAVSCNFEETFAAYMMGASGSGKSTLLHTLIAGILMNYHPDEVELWLLDFKMTEFKIYFNCCPPHIKYILLEKSEDLVFDIIDRLTDILEDRQRIFASAKPEVWRKLADVPLDRNMPAIFVIIDEFAQMSQIISGTKGAGDRDYTVKLSNLLAKGRAFGLKFIFASQTYITGVAGLTEGAREQIQIRFALKNTVEEIRQTLNLASGEITPEISRYMASLPPYETLFKRRDENGEVKIGKYRNLYAGQNEIRDLINKINAAMKPLPEKGATDKDNSYYYIDKKPVLIDNTPRTFESQIACYRQFEADMDADEIDDGDVLIYPGVPCSFNLAKPFALCCGRAENILLVGGRRNERISVVLSILCSYKRGGGAIEVWSHNRNSDFRKYRNFFDIGESRKISDLGEICRRISEIKSDIENKNVRPGLIVCMGYKLIAADFEYLGDGSVQIPEKLNVSRKSSGPDLNEIMKTAMACTDEAERKRMIEEFNAQVNSEKSTGKLYNAMDDMKRIVKNAPAFGLHFLFCFEQAADFTHLSLDARVFKHRILFSISEEESILFTGRKKASAISGGVFFKTTDKEDVCSMRPHIFKNIPLNGFFVDDKGEVVQNL